MPEKTIADPEPKNNIMKPIVPGRRVEIVGCNFGVVVQSMDPKENLNYMSTLAANLYNHLRKLEGFE